MNIKKYPKVYEDVFDIKKWFSKQEHYLGAVDMSIDELIDLTKEFYKEEAQHRFEMIVKQIWIEQNLTVSGVRRSKRVGNGIHGDLYFGRFTKFSVGMSHRFITADFVFTPIATYLSDFFPEFLHNNPFEEPEKYKYPYNHVNLDHLVFVYQMDERLELLKEAEEKQMSFPEFVNFVYNWALCYNDDVAKGQKYEMIGGNRHWQHIRNHSLDMFWENDKFRFDSKK